MYIGSHKGTIDDGYIGSGNLFKKAYKKYGKHNFSREIVYTGKHFRELEEFILEEVNAKDSDEYYNLCNYSGGFSSGVNNPNYGKSISGESNGMYGRKHSEETKRLISLNRSENSYFCEHTQKMYNTMNELALDLNISKVYAYTMCGGHDRNKFGIRRVNK